MEKTEVVKDINLQKRYKVKNLCPWDLGIGQMGLDLNLPANGIVQLTGEILDLLVSNDNIFLCGTGGGDHAKIAILDEDLKKYFEFDKQVILDEEKIAKIMEYKTDSTFESKVKSEVVMSHEKEILYNYILKNQETLSLTIKRMNFLKQHIGREFDF
jgi:hypothetical protein